MKLSPNDCPVTIENQTREIPMVNILNIAYSIKAIFMICSTTYIGVGNLFYPVIDQQEPVIYPSHILPLPGSKTQVRNLCS